jgi:hypothetical protein
MEGAAKRGEEEAEENELYVQPLQHRSKIPTQVQRYQVGTQQLVSRCDSFP